MNDLDSFKNEIRQFEESRQKRIDSLEQSSVNRSFVSTYTDHINPFPFNPNQLPEKKWKELGLNDKQIKIIKNYEERGGKFYKADDLAKIYGISQAEFEKLKPFILIKNKPENLTIDKRVLNPFEFNPNTIDINGLTRLGLSDKLCKTILNYREKGGHFYKAEDFGKMYNMDSLTFRQLFPFILIPKDSLVTIYENKPILMLDINSSDTLDLQQLSGIGPSFARRIVNYGELLGGYYQKEQLMEVFGMDSLRFAQIKDHVKASPEYILKININTAGIKDLIKHPYIEFYLAKSIIKQRDKIGSYEHLDELLDANLIYDELYQKLKPYLTL